MLVFLGICNGNTLWITFRGRSKEMYFWLHSVHRVNVSWRREGWGELLLRRKFGNWEGNSYQHRWSFACVINFLLCLISVPNEHDFLLPDTLHFFLVGVAGSMKVSYMTL